MKLHLTDSADFYVADFFVDPSDGSRLTTATIVLRIFEPSWGGTWKAWDTSQSAGSHFQASVTDANSKITMTHKTAGGLDTGIFESAVLDYTSFTAGNTYIFQFENTDHATGQFQSYEVQYQGAALWGNVAQWNGAAVATPSVAGVPEVDVTHVSGAAEDVATATAVAALPTADGNADALLDRVNGVETGITPRQALRAIAAVLAGTASGGPGSSAFAAINNSGTTRVTSTAGTTGDRSVVTLNL